MPFKLSKPCKQPGCPALIQSGTYCPAHQASAVFACKAAGCPEMVSWGEYYCPAHKREAERAQEAQRHPANDFYHTNSWRKLRDKYISENPRCAGCGTLGSMVDHIKPIQAGGEPLEWGNLQTLCRACHRRKTAQDLRASTSLQTSGSAHSGPYKPK